MIAVAVELQALRELAPSITKGFGCIYHQRTAVAALQWSSRAIQLCDLHCAYSPSYTAASASINSSPQKQENHGSETHYNLAICTPKLLYGY